MTADERFVSRWSRLKQGARAPEEKPAQPKTEASPAPVAAPSAQGKEPPGPAPEAPQLPPIDSLKGLASDYTEFLKPGVDESLKRSALKQLFKDPYFETFEKFEAYCEDYTQGEPIPPAMLRTLEHAKGLLFDEKEEDKKTEEGRTVAALEPAQPEPKPERPHEPEAPAPGEAKPEAVPARPQEKA